MFVVTGKVNLRKRLLSLPQSVPLAFWGDTLRNTSRSRGCLPLANEVALRHMNRQTTQPRVADEMST